MTRLGSSASIRKPLARREDWRIHNGAAECSSKLGGRSLQSLTHELRNSAASFTMSVTLDRLLEKSKDGGAGFKIGVGSEIEAHRFLIDMTDGNPKSQFPGWPVTIHQEENRGSNRIK